MKESRNEYLDRMVHVLGERLKPLLLQCRPKVKAAIANPRGEGKIVLWMWYPYDASVHKGRSFTVDSETPKIDRLRVSEMNVLGTIVASIIESDFEADYVGFSDGKAEYSLVPKNA